MSLSTTVLWRDKLQAGKWLCFSEKTGPMAVLVYSGVEICSHLEKIFLLGLSEQLQNSSGSWILQQNLHERPSSSV